MNMTANAMAIPTPAFPPIDRPFFFFFFFKVVVPVAVDVRLDVVFELRSVPDEDCVTKTAEEADARGDDKMGAVADCVETSGSAEVTAAVVPVAQNY
jgi:hypothetical protein